MRTLSPSQIETWLRCRLAWHYSAERRLSPIVGTKPYMTLGSAVHDAYEQFYLTPPPSRGKDVFLANFARAWPELCTADNVELTDEDNVEYLAKGSAMVSQLWAAHGQDTAWSDVDAEKNMETVLRVPDSAGFSERQHAAPALLRCRADLVVKTDDFVIVDDLKTTSKKPNAAQYLHWKLQLRLNGLVAHYHYNKPVKISATVVSVQGVDRRQRLMLQSELEETARLVTQVAWEMDNTVRIPSESTACRFCSYQPICLVRITGGDTEGIMGRDYTQREAEKKEISDED